MALWEAKLSFVPDLEAVIDAKLNESEALKGWCVYLLRLADGSLYCGCTNDLQNRVRQHAEGKGSRLVKSRLPFSLVYFESVVPPTRSRAQQREAEIKKLRKHEKEKILIRTAQPQKRNA